MSVGFDFDFDFDGDQVGVGLVIMMKVKCLDSWNLICRISNLERKLMFESV